MSATPERIEVARQLGLPVSDLLDGRKDACRSGAQVIALAQGGFVALSSIEVEVAHMLGLSLPDFAEAKQKRCAR